MQLRSPNQVVGLRSSLGRDCVVSFIKDGMARKPRVEFDGAVYHVICRGNQPLDDSAVMRIETII